MIQTKSVKVHDETHRTLMSLKAKRRSRSIDQVIREMIRNSTGAPVEDPPAVGDERLTDYLSE